MYYLITPLVIRPFPATPEKLRYLDLTLPGVIEQKFAPPVALELLPVPMLDFENFTHEELHS
jgi:hypothetical protein